MRRAEIARAIGLPRARYEHLPKSDKSFLEAWHELGSGGSA